MLAELITESWFDFIVYIKWIGIILAWMAGVFIWIGLFAFLSDYIEEKTGENFGFPIMLCCFILLFFQFCVIDNYKKIKNKDEYSERRR